MQQLTITPNIERHPWEHLANKEILEGTLVGVGGMPDGTVEGHPAVMLEVELPDGRVVVAQTTLRLFASASDAIIANLGDPRHD